jgi:hypothetical protein
MDEQTAKEDDEKKAHYSRINFGKDFVVCRVFSNYFARRFGKLLQKIIQHESLNLKK